jgi:hypothetical protein
MLVGVPAAGCRLISPMMFMSVDGRLDYGDDWLLAIGNHIPSEATDIR